MEGSAGRGGGGVKRFVEECLYLRGDKCNGCLIFVFRVISWSLWLNRND
jgi:hypothetical protein